MLFIDLSLCLCPSFMAEKVVSGIRENVSGSRAGGDWGVVGEGELFWNAPGLPNFHHRGS